MKLSTMQVEKLLKADSKFKLFAFALMISRMKRHYAEDPFVVDAFTVEINDFLREYDSIMDRDYDTVKAIVGGGKVC